MKQIELWIKKLKSLWEDRENQAKYWSWMIRYAKPYIFKIFLIMMMNLASSLINVGMAVISKNIIDTASAGNTDIGRMIFFYFACILCSLLLTAINTMVTVVLTEKFSFSIRKQLYEKIIRSQWIDIQKYHTGDLMTRLTSDAGSVSDGIIGTVPDLLRLFLELLVVFFTLFYYSRLLAVLALMIAPIAAVCSFVFGRVLKRVQIKVQESESAYRSFLQESLANLLIVKSFANEDYAVDRLTQLRDTRFYWVFKKSKLNLATSITMSMTFQVGYIAAFAYGAIQISRKLITYGTMSVFLTLINRVQSPIMQLAANIPKLVSILASAGRIMELQAIPAESKADKHLTAAQSVGVSIANLSFEYTEDTPVLENVTANIKPGDFIAITGESGAGKTTLVCLLMSFLRGTKGSMEFYNNQGEREPSNAGIRNFVSYVPQGNTLFSGTVLENIRLGKLDATQEEILTALKQSAGYDFVSHLPKGLDTVIGERGHGLSEGQAQRIAIARALVKKAPFLIMDEATSALDEKTELAVLEGLRKLAPRPTCLLITHRQSILKYCDYHIHISDKHLSTVKL